MPRIRISRAVGWPIALAATITFCSGYPAAVPSGFDVDKIGHFGAYGALATAAVRIPGRGRLSRIGWWAILVASAYGMGDEFRQSLTHGVRTPDWHDWLADTLGAVTAVALYLRWSWYRRWMEFPVWKRRKPDQPRIENSGESSPTAAA